MTPTISFEVKQYLVKAKSEGLGLYKIWFTSRLLCTNQSSFACPLLPAFSRTIAILLHVYCEIYDAQTTTLCTPHTIQYW